MKLGTSAEEFIWASGVENTFVPQERPGHRSLDEYLLMGHYEHWREDLSLAVDLGLQAIRWGVPWYRVEPFPNEFDWRWTDAVVDWLLERDLTPIVDLMHYGCPYWLRREFASSEYPAAVSAYASAFTRRYGDRLRWYTPLNEPLVNALMCGKLGQWPPYFRGDHGYIKVLLQLIKGMQATADAIRAQVTDPVLVWVEAVGLHVAFSEALEVLAAEDRRRGYISYDLLTGRVDTAHPLFPWLIRNGASLHDLEEIARNRVHLDVLGMNFYPQWSRQSVMLDAKGRLAYRNAEDDGAAFGSILRDYQERYGAPVIVTETSAFGTDEVRARWLEGSVAEVRRLRSQGVPILGYTWFPMLTMIDWKYRLGRKPREAYRIELGLYTSRDPGDPGAGRWKPTPLVGKLRAYVNDPVRSVGPLVPAAASQESPR